MRDEIQSIPERERRSDSKGEMMDYKELYDTNENFKTFVDKVCKSYGLTVAEALEHHTVKDVGDYYTDPLYRTGVSCETINVGCGGASNA